MTTDLSDAARPTYPQLDLKPGINEFASDKSPERIAWEIAQLRATNKLKEMMANENVYTCESVYCEQETPEPKSEAIILKLVS